MKKLAVIAILAGLVTLVGCAGQGLKEAKQVNTVAAYDNFLKEYPKHDLAKEARQLREKAVINEAKKADTIQSYEKYFKEYPNGSFTSKAHSRLETLYFEEAKQFDSVEAYKEFLQKYPQSEFTNVAKNRIEELEKSDWQKTRDLNTVEGYKAFLKKYPGSKFTSLTEDEIKFLMKSSSCRKRKELYHIIQEVLSKKTKEKLENLYGYCIRADNFCEDCGNPAVGWCHMRNKYVCEKHRYFTQGGRSWRCP